MHCTLSSPSVQESQAHTDLNQNGRCRSKKGDARGLFLKLQPCVAILLLGEKVTSVTKVSSIRPAKGESQINIFISGIWQKSTAPLKGNRLPSTSKTPQVPEKTSLCSH